ncbi:MAG: HAD-IA family hydrolase [Acidobacteriota bacterium]|nr:MAG: HAD-IA family hydrolase [Acidobacteriota bacterium]
MKESTAVLFDWDGTLLDSFPAGYHASIAVLQHYGIDVDRERFLETYSPNWYESYEKLGVPREEWDNADRMWRRTYRYEVSEPFPFVRRLLASLRDSGLALGLVTAGNRDRVLGELDDFDLGEFFAAVVCFEDTEEKKPHPAPLTRALVQLDVAPQATIYVGDRPEDIVMGQKVGAYTVGVESEYGPRSALEEAAPDLILPHAGHLVDSGLLHPTQ